MKYSYYLYTTYEETEVRVIQITNGGKLGLKMSSTASKNHTKILTYISFLIDAIAEV